MLLDWRLLVLLDWRLLVLLDWRLLVLLDWRMLWDCAWGLTVALFECFHSDTTIIYQLSIGESICSMAAQPLAMMLASILFRLFFSG